MAQHQISIVIFYNNDKVVLRQGKVHQDPSSYDFWGGNLQNQETPLQCIKRVLNQDLNYYPSVSSTGQIMSLLFSHPAPVRATTIFCIFLYLQLLQIYFSPKLKVVPSWLFFHSVSF